MVVSFKHQWKLVKHSRWQVRICTLQFSLITSFFPVNRQLSGACAQSKAHLATFGCLCLLVIQEGRQISLKHVFNFWTYMYILLALARSEQFSCQFGRKIWQCLGFVQDNALWADPAEGSCYKVPFTWLVYCPVHSLVHSTTYVIELLTQGLNWQSHSPSILTHSALQCHACHEQHSCLFNLTVSIISLPLLHSPWIGW